MKPAAALMGQYNAVWLLFTILGSAVGVVVVAAAARMILKGRRRRSSDGERSALRHTLGGKGQRTLHQFPRRKSVTGPQHHRARGSVALY